MNRRIKTRIFRGYKQFWDRREKRWVFTHRRAVENVAGRELSSDEHVHHINGDKQDNRVSNLVALKPSIHRRIHHEDRDACFKCGLSGHWASACDEVVDIDGHLL